MLGDEPVLVLRRPSCLEENCRNSARAVLVLPPKADAACLLGGRAGCPFGREGAADNRVLQGICVLLGRLNVKNNAPTAISLCSALG